MIYADDREHVICSYGFLTATTFSALEAPLEFMVRITLVLLVLFADQIGKCGFHDMSRHGLGATWFSLCKLEDSPWKKMDYYNDLEGSSMALSSFEIY